MEGKIIQIMPCGEIYAVFKDKDGEEYRDRVACLALMENIRDEGDRWVTGLVIEDTWFSDPEEVSNFFRYEFKDKGPDS